MIADNPNALISYPPGPEGTPPRVPGPSSRERGGVLRRVIVSGTDRLKFVLASNGAIQQAIGIVCRMRS